MTRMISKITLIISMKAFKNNISLEGAVYLS